MPNIINIILLIIYTIDEWSVIMSDHRKKSFFSSIPNGFLSRDWYNICIYICNKNCVLWSSRVYQIVYHSIILYASYSGKCIFNALKKRDRTVSVTAASMVAIAALRTLNYYFSNNSNYYIILCFIRNKLNIMCTHQARMHGLMIRMRTVVRQHKIKLLTCSFKYLLHMCKVLRIQ